MEIQWEEPPAHAHVIGSGQKPGRYLQFAQTLRKHPGKWAVLPSEHRSKTSADGTAQNIRRGKVKGFAPANSFETAVAEEDGKAKIWVRYVGAEKKVPESATTPPPPPPKDESPQPEPLAKNVRAWAQGQGIEVPERGRLPQDLIEKYAAALQEGESGLHLRAVPHPK